jgi:hypothetical protein
MAKPNLMGVFDTMVTNALPAMLPPFYLYSDFRLGKADKPVSVARTAKISIYVLGPSRRRHTVVENQDVPVEPSHFSDGPVGISLNTFMNGIQAEKPGEYRILFVMDGQRINGPTLFLRVQPEPPRA